MELMRLGERGSERPAVRDDGGLFDLSGLTADVSGDFLGDGGMNRVRAALAAGSLPSLSDTAPDGTGPRVGAPVAKPGAVICIGQNYAAHAAESGSTPPERPIIFFKHPNTVVGPDDDVRIPPGATKVDWEVELAVVIGRQARYLSSPDEALAHVAGYAIGNDVSERSLQIEQSGGQWSKGKSAETFNPLGPWLACDIQDPQKLRLRSWVNGEPRQDSSTADMIFSVARLVFDLSQYLVLDPGDVINTGTPEGVALSGRFPYLDTGDVVELEIDGLGRQRQTIR
ncbi:2-keto-4-pentenoate hydratase/2-oxohepta-3-ene-1,7-dioic acid hydratase in catechol pathway [Amycolatopsis endophytica]|uniref:2-keto-4-pentenoate hydratase/2-oxohepta-3-ene-1,7-dioic acid hydratase in catechol pathway n=1 Tax=Amycolatopsis endophytica TaxID=860233 RepID=A0A853B1S5_9PSEU|nr:fumarylacetoacetate hydrolase family protein [Amycolatopsis endophytica]NYI88777.1 2-keto-4-pentenoate hydratase/2-oxohepta-3-ene-1,7-dioic acid hydratase in catechol pathway [Amycolatopsis endophytica]